MGSLGRRASPYPTVGNTMIGLVTERPARHVVALGAHCDDIAIGCGATLSAMCSVPGTVVHAVVLTGAGTPRESEERAALTRLCGDAELNVEILDLADGRVPADFDRAKDAIVAARTAMERVDIVLAPHRDDAHQDHRTVAEIAPTVFRDQLILGYEILKWESDLPKTIAYQPIPDDQMQAKIDLLHACYPSQTGHDWFDDEAFRGLARIRGAQAHTRYAEAFTIEKLTLTLGEQ